MLSSSASTRALSKNRMTSLETLRGLAIFGMLLVNNPGNSAVVFYPLRHSDWHGCSIADQIFPCFLFVVGASMAFSFSKYREQHKERASILAVILRRTICLFILGLLINGFPTYDPSTIRIMGVLQRIGLTYLIASLGILLLPRHWLCLLAGSILIGYWVSLQCISAPGYDAGDLSVEANLSGYIDRILFTRAHLYYAGLYDPEGLLATLPAAVTVLSGYFTVKWLETQPVSNLTSAKLGLAGVIGILCGYIWGFLLPLNKSLWTSSYAAFTFGWSLVLLASCYYLVEVRAWRRLSHPFEALSGNAIIIFVGSSLVEQGVAHTPSGASIQALIFDNLFLPLADPTDASLIYSLSAASGWWIFAYVLYGRRIFVRI